MKFTPAVLTCLLLTACGQGDHDPAETTAPVEAVTSNPAAQSTQAPSAASAQSYQQDARGNVADRIDADASSASTSDALAACEGLDTTQRSDCELRARQGLDPASQDAAQDISATPPTPVTDRATPAEALPSSTDDPAETEGEDDER